MYWIYRKLRNERISEYGYVNRGAQELLPCGDQADLFSCQTAYCDEEPVMHRGRPRWKGCSHHML